MAMDASKAAAQGGKGGKADKKADKKAPEKKAEKKADKKPAPAPAAAAEEAPAKKEKNPLDLLPPSKMIMDAWKRLYSNTPAKNFRAICIERLWKGGPVPNSLNDEVFGGWDPEGYSMWFCDYKYNDENTVNFIVMNKVSGFLQRLDYVRKYAFGVMCILKKDGLYPVKGLWIFRGQQMPQQMQDESYDVELYEWKRADPEDPAHRKLIEDMLCEEDYIEGMEHVEAKIFK